MPLFIPKQETVVAFFEPLLEHGERIETAFWCEQRLPLWLAYLIDEVPLGDIVFMKIRHRYFACLTDRRLLFMGSSGMHNPIPAKLRYYPRASVSCKQFTNWFGGHVSMDLLIDGQLQRYRVPRVGSFERHSEPQLVRMTPGVLAEGCEPRDPLARVVDSGQVESVPAVAEGCRPTKRRIAVASDDDRDPPIAHGLWVDPDRIK